MHRNMTGIAASVEYIVMTVISHMEMDLSYSSIPSGFCIKWTVGTSDIGGNWLRMKLDFVFLRFSRFEVRH